MFSIWPTKCTGQRFLWQHSKGREEACAQGQGASHNSIVCIIPFCFSASLLGCVDMLTLKSVVCVSFDSKISLCLILPWPSKQHDRELCLIGLGPVLETVLEIDCDPTVNLSCAVQAAASSTLKNPLTQLGPWNKPFSEISAELECFSI